MILYTHLICIVMEILMRQNLLTTDLVTVVPTSENLQPTRDPILEVDPPLVNHINTSKCRKTKGQVIQNRRLLFLKCTLRCTRRNTGKMNLAGLFFKLIKLRRKKVSHNASVIVKKQLLQKLKLI